MRIGKKAPEIFQYPVKIENAEQQDETHNFDDKQISKIVERLSKKLEMVLGKYIHSGRNIWVT